MVYVISDNAGHVKIGVAINVETRLKQLQTANANELDIVMVFEHGFNGNDRWLEECLHSYFSEYNICNSNIGKSEWFDGCILPELFEICENQSNDNNFFVDFFKRHNIKPIIGNPIKETLANYRRATEMKQAEIRTLREKIANDKIKEKELRQKIKQKDETIKELKFRLNTERKRGKRRKD